MVDALIVACLAGSGVLTILGGISMHAFDGKKWEDTLTKCLLIGAFTLACSIIILATIESIKCYG